MRGGKTGESVWKIIEYPQRDAESSHIFLTRTRSPISCSHMHAFGVINKMFKHTFWSHCVDLTLNALPWFFSAPQPPFDPFLRDATDNDDDSNDILMLPVQL